MRQGDVCQMSGVYEISAMASTCWVSFSLVRVVRGRGYSLARDPRDISLNDILQALEVSEKVVHCLEPGKDCPREECCPTRTIWQGLDRVVNDYLAEFTLADLVAG